MRVGSTTRPDVSQWWTPEVNAIADHLRNMINQNRTLSRIELRSENFDALCEAMQHVVVWDKETQTYFVDNMLYCSPSIQEENFKFKNVPVVRVPA